VARPSLNLYNNLENWSGGAYDWQHAYQQLRLQSSLTSHGCDTRYSNWNAACCGTPAQCRCREVTRKNYRTNSKQQFACAVKSCVY